MTFQNETIWIIGASSGIGAALAKELATLGATLLLSARREQELQQLQQLLGDKKHKIYPLDVSDPKAIKATLTTITTEFNAINRVIFMAATFRSENIKTLDENFIQQLITINLMGAIYCSYTVLPVFKKQLFGQLAICASVAGYVGMPGGQPYSATKAALINFCESLYVETPNYIDIKVINPGFVRTRITDKNRFYMPFRIETETAAKAIVKGLNRKAFEIHFPKAFTFTMKLIRWLPYIIKLSLIKKLSQKVIS